MGDIISLEAYRKRRAAELAPLSSPQKPARKGAKDTQRSTVTVKPAPVDATERDKDPPVD